MSSCKSILKKISLPILLMALAVHQIQAYETIKVIGIDKGLWKEISIPKKWTYLDCQSSFVEYPDFTAPTIHYVLHFIDENDHKIELRFNRYKGRLDKNAFLFDMTDFKEKYIRIKK